MRVIRDQRRLNICARISTEQNNKQQTPGNLKPAATRARPQQTLQNLSFLRVTNVLGTSHSIYDQSHAEMPVWAFQTRQNKMKCEQMFYVMQGAWQASSMTPTCVCLCECSKNIKNSSDRVDAQTCVPCHSHGLRLWTNNFVCYEALFASTKIFGWRMHKHVTAANSERKICTACSDRCPPTVWRASHTWLQSKKVTAIVAI